MFSVGIKSRPVAWNGQEMIEICWKLTLKISEQRYQRCDGVFIINSEPVSRIPQGYMMLALQNILLAG